jgi:hypothetical protein
MASKELTLFIKYKDKETRLSLRPSDKFGPHITAFRTEKKNQNICFYYLGGHDGKKQYYVSADDSPESLGLSNGAKLEALEYNDLRT